MIICMREGYFKESNVTWDEIEKKDLLKGRSDLKLIRGEKANSKSPNLKEIKTFSQLISKVRHAFAHNCFNIKINDVTKKIESVTVWNKPSDKKNKPENYTWQADISELSLKNIAYLILDYIEKELG
jgi:hypothetical protein